MTIALDASTPAKTTIAANATSQASNAFSPPANSLIVVFWGLQEVDSTVAQSVTAMSNTGTALTWTRKVLANHSGAAPGGSAEIWSAYNTSAQINITVSGTFARASSGSTDQNGGILAPKVFTGTAISLTSAASALKNSTTAGVPTASVTTTAANSWVWGVVVNWDNSTIGTAGTAQTITDSVNDTTAGDAEWVQRQNATTPASGTSVTINDTAPSTHYLLAMVEVLATTTVVNTKTLSVAGVGAVSLTKQVIKPQIVAGIGAVSVVKVAQKPPKVTGIAVASLAKQVTKPLTVTEVGAVSLTTIRVVVQTLSVVGVGAVSLVKLAQKAQAVASAGTVSLAKLDQRTPLSVVGSGVASLAKVPVKNLSVTGSGLVVVTKKAVKPLKVTGVGVLSLAKLISRAQAVAGVGVVRLIKLDQRSPLSVVGVGAVSLVVVKLPGLTGPQPGFMELFRWSLATVDLAGEEIATMTLDAEPVATMELLLVRLP